MTRAAKASLLFFFFSLCAAAIIITHDLQKRTPVPPPHELYSIVNNQLAAFRASDFARAYQHASSGVQQKFPLPQFEEMIRRNYAEMTRTERVEFGFVKVQDGNAIVQVFFFAADGNVHTFLYSLVAEDATWKIEGVAPVRVARPRHGLLHI